MFATTLRLARLTWPRLAVRDLANKLLLADQRYRSRQQLKELDDHLLRDIGVTRADVAAELRRPLI